MADPTVEDVDAFIAEYKTLDGFFSPWGQRRGLNWESRWGILNSLNARVGELSFSINAYLTKPTICALFRQRLIYRLDVVPMDECKSNDWVPNPWGSPRACVAPIHMHGKITALGSKATDSGNCRFAILSICQMGLSSGS